MQSRPLKEIVSGFGPKNKAEQAVREVIAYAQDSWRRFQQTGKPRVCGVHLTGSTGAFQRPSDKEMIAEIAGQAVIVSLLRYCTQTRGELTQADLDECHGVLRDLQIHPEIHENWPHFFEKTVRELKLPIAAKSQNWLQKSAELHHKAAVRSTMDRVLGTHSENSAVGDLVEVTPSFPKKAGAKKWHHSVMDWFAAQFRKRRP